MPKTARVKACAAQVWECGMWRCLEELQECLPSRFGLFLRDPGVFQNDKRYILRYQSHLPRQHVSICLFAADCEDWQAELGL